MRRRIADHTAMERRRKKDRERHRRAHAAERAARAEPATGLVLPGQRHATYWSTVAARVTPAWEGQMNARQLAEKTGLRQGTISAYIRRLQVQGQALKHGGGRWATFSQVPA
jgi:hypothetical protein